MQLAGLDALAFVRSTNRFDTLLMQAIAARCAQFRSDEREQLAVDIANAVAHMLGAD